MAIDEAFCAGVRRGLEGDVLTAELFSVRAGVLLGTTRKEDATDYTSGLLIGADVGSSIRHGVGTVYVMGRPELTELYAAAIALAGRNAKEIDGETAFLAGIKAIAGRI
jgi:2-dehydro-3-deoxygalactonokinase